MKDHLYECHKQYEKIMQSGLSDFQKDRELSDLMSYMERNFSIPSLQNEEWEKKNRKVIALYRKVSLSRSL
ncbi:hypothetical protein [Halobacillus ihumii]|uniref:hypothetical protein n=1 Tax=Halobacillus ihumii TaxID=2686092 RepID=UPI0013D05758|nr:hypothetical protein [Halobacillus ihumii]